jgi:hypothetical protein
MKERAMNTSTPTNRRAFFLQSSALLSAGVAGTLSATPTQAASRQPTTDPHPALTDAADREAIRQLHYTFTRLIEERNYEAATALFDAQAELTLSGESARGRDGIGKLLIEGYRQQTVTALHAAYRANPRQQQDHIALHDDRRRAHALWHVDVAIGVPLRDDCTAAQMARLQGQLADRYWESGHLDAEYVRSGTGWQLATLRYSNT